MAVIGLPRAGVQPIVLGAPPVPSAALRAWVAAHYAPKLRAGALMNLARNPTRAQQLLHPPGPVYKSVHIDRAAPLIGTPVVTPGLAAPAVADPYSAFPDYAQQALKQMDADRLAAQGQATTTAAWLAPAMQALQQGQQQAQGAYASTLAGLFGNQGQLGPAQVAATSPGGVVSGPVNAAIGASQQAAPMQAASQQALGGVQSFLGNQKVTDIGAGALGNLAYQAAQIPTVFAARKNEYMGKLTQALSEAQAQAESDAAKLAEQQRQFAITNATTLRGQDIGLARTTIGTTGKAGAAAKVTGSVIPVAPGTSAPAGYQTVTAADGNTYAVKAPTPPKPPAAPKPASNWYAGPKRKELVKAGYVATPVTVNGKAGFRYVKAAAGSTASGASKALTPSQRTSISSSFTKLWKGSGVLRDPSTGRVLQGTPGASDADPATASRQVVSFIRTYADSVPIPTLFNIIGSVDPAARVLAERWFAGQAK